MERQQVASSVDIEWEGAEMTVRTRYGGGWVVPTRTPIGLWDRDDDGEDFIVGDDAAGADLDDLDVEVLDGLDEEADP
jgi:hypothetical protein